MRRILLLSVLVALAIFANAQKQEPSDSEAPAAVTDDEDYVFITTECKCPRKPACRPRRTFIRARPAMSGPRRRPKCCPPLPACRPIQPMPTSDEIEGQMQEAVNDAVMEVAVRRERRVKRREMLRRQQLAKYTYTPGSYRSGPPASSPFAGTDVPADVSGTSPPGPLPKWMRPVAALNVKGSYQGAPVDVDIYMDSRGSVIPNTVAQPSMVVRNKDKLKSAVKEMKAKRYKRKMVQLTQDLLDTQQKQHELADALEAGKNSTTAKIDKPVPGSIVKVTPTDVAGPVIPQVAPPAARAAAPTPTPAAKPSASLKLPKAQDAVTTVVKKVARKVKKAGKKYKKKSSKKP